MASLLRRIKVAYREWRRLAERHHLIVIAELHSTLSEPEAVYATWPSLRGCIAGLDWNAITQ